MRTRNDDAIQTQILTRSLLLTRPVENQQGQALVEYVLILVVTVTLTIGLASQIFKPLQVFLKSYMGDYTSCLLETGELPQLGSQTPAGCEMPKFTPGTAQGGTAGVSSSSSSDGQGRKSRDGNSAGSSDSELSRGNGGNNYSSSNRRSSISGGLNRSPSSTDGSGGKTSGKTIEVPIGGDNNNFFKGTATGYNLGNGSSRKKSVILDGGTVSEKEKKKERENLITHTLQGDSYNLRAKKVLVKPPEIKFDPEKVEKEPGFSIGNFFRILFILAIIILILTLVGGQVAQMVKSWEK